MVKRAHNDNPIQPEISGNVRTPVEKAKLRRLNWKSNLQSVIFCSLWSLEVSRLALHH